MPYQSDHEKERLKKNLYRRFSQHGLMRLKVRRFLYSLGWIFVIQFLQSTKRIVDILFALLIMVPLFPIYAAFFIAYAMRHPMIRTIRRVGRWCVEFDEYYWELPQNQFGDFLRQIKLYRLPVMINILKGDMSFVGPRLVSPGEMSPREKAIRKRYSAAPGLICLWQIRKAGNVHYGHEHESDAEYIDNQSIRGDFGILLRGIPAMLYGEGVDVAPDLITILNIPINNLTMMETIAWILERLEKNQGTSQICFVNADCVNIAYRQQEYLEVLNDSSLVLADGIGLKLAGKFLQQQIKQNVNGTDLFPRLCEALSGTPKRIYLLGARPEAIEGVSSWLRKHYPQVMIAGMQHGYFKPEEEAGVIREIASSQTDILFVAFGAPRQDLWIRKHLKFLNVKIAVGVGGLFDFYSGRIPRAPLWMREIGLEWIYRLYQEPLRMWKRYILGNVAFLYRVFKERFFRRS
ncbi:MAG: WecB/TagA/CpsF family glycosyltransferase [Candidatus Omnitrophica bacterium]|nr:WecB/TagA/CpsF family glycosyltransferase [Candidatus Omnitrophota bacterium]